MDGHGRIYTGLERRKLAAFEFSNLKVLFKTLTSLLTVNVNSPSKLPKYVEERAVMPTRTWAKRHDLGQTQLGIFVVPMAGACADTTVTRCKSILGSSP